MSKKFLVGWKKGDERSERFDRAMKRAPMVRLELVRALLDAWADTILGRATSDIEDAAKSVADNQKKKK